MYKATKCDASTRICKFSVIIAVYFPGVLIIIASAVGTKLGH